MRQLFLADLAGKSAQEVADTLTREFRTERPVDPDSLLVAYIGEESYDGDAWILFRGTDGELYEVSGSHCSCCGFEGQWEPQVSSAVYLKSDRFSPGCYCSDANEAAIRKYLAEEL